MNDKLEIATLANGCFGAVKQSSKDSKVKSVLPGYSGGIVKILPMTKYAQENRHAESIQIEFDPKVIPFERILDIFWHTRSNYFNRQGNDVGTQYRSAIFYHNQKQKEIAEKSKKEP